MLSECGSKTKQFEPSQVLYANLSLLEKSSIFSSASRKSIGCLCVTYYKDYYFHVRIIIISLEQVTERKRLDGGNSSISSRSDKEVSFLGLDGVTLQVNLLATLTSSLLGSLVGFDTGDDLLLALGLADVLDTNMDTLLKDASVDILVHTNTDGRLGNIEDDTGTSVVVLVGHTLMDTGVGENINVIADLHGKHVLGEGGQAMLPELLGKHVARTRTDSE